MQLSTSENHAPMSQSASMLMLLPILGMKRGEPGCLSKSAVAHSHSDFASSVLFSGSVVASFTVFLACGPSLDSELEHFINLR